MYFDLNISVPPPPIVVNYNQQNKNKKGEQKPGQRKLIEPPNGSWFSPEQIAAVDARVEVLVYHTYAATVLL